MDEFRPPIAEDYAYWEERTRLRNEKTLAPLAPGGRWRLFRTHEDTTDGIICRTLVFAGFEGGYVKYTPGDLYIWDGRETP